MVVPQPSSPVRLDAGVHAAARAHVMVSAPALAGTPAPAEVDGAPEEDTRRAKRARLAAASHPCQRRAGCQFRRARGSSSGLWCRIGWSARPHPPGPDGGKPSAIRHRSRALSWDGLIAFASSSPRLIRGASPGTGDRLREDSRPPLPYCQGGDPNHDYCYRVGVWFAVELR